MKGIFIPDITVEMFRNGCLEGIEALMAEGEIYDIEYDPKSEEPGRKKVKWIYYDTNGFKCSRCGSYLEIGCGDVKMNFCPNCGSYNGGEQE